MMRKNGNIRKVYPEVICLRYIKKILGQSSKSHTDNLDNGFWLNTLFLKNWICLEDVSEKIYLI
jgi:hypothetical protein